MMRKVLQLTSCHYFTYFILALCLPFVIDTSLDHQSLHSIGLQSGDEDLWKVL